MCIRDRLIVVHFGHRTINRQLGEVGATEPDQLGVQVGEVAELQLSLIHI